MWLADMPKKGMTDQGERGLRSAFRHRVYLTSKVTINSDIWNEKKLYPRILWRCGCITQ